MLVKYGLTDYVRVLRLDAGISFARDILFKKKAAILRRYTRWQRLRMAIEELGPTYVKLGQLLSNRNDLLPVQLVRELELLQDGVPPITAQAVRRVVERELGKRVEDVFLEFEWEPVASASIAQVHRARLHNGQLVAVKVQRPNIEQVVEADLVMLTQLASLVEKYLPSTRFLALNDIVAEFKTRIRIEMDFTRELLYMEKFQNLFGDTKYTKVPRGYRELTTRHVLTMQYIDGIPVTDVIDDGSGYNKKLLALRGARFVLEQVFVHGFFHADPHPGNVMILPGNVVCFVDYGMMGRIRPTEMEQLRAMFLGMTNRDARSTAKALLRLTKQLGHVSVNDLEAQVFDVLDEYLDLALEDIDLAGLFSDLLSMLHSFQLVLPANLILMMKALISIQGIGVRLHPGFNLMQLFRPFARRLVLAEYEPKRLATEAYRTATDFRKFALDLPADLDQIVELVKHGNIGVKLRIQGLERLRSTLERVSFRLVQSAVIAALIVGSSIMLGTSVPPLWNGMSLFGLIALALAAVIGMVSVVTIVIRALRQ
ncbi:MAG: AarF/ABC1/UbiB kinase family protein [Spirochaetaceae bacterium]|nr:MAG: AarF/ABC1/UbiB kinase family protein [Spirochaetaceae bacterium]